MSKDFILLHISDLHLHRLPLNPLKYLSKRVLGMSNLVLRRAREFPLQRAKSLVEQISASHWDHLLITGDLTQLGFPEEFRLAREVLAPLLERGPEKVTVLPGNHDRYVAEATPGGAFTRFFGEFAPVEGPAGGILTRHLAGPWHLAGWDSAAPAPWFYASGTVLEQALEATRDWLERLPPGSRAMVANHYPVVFPAPHAYKPRHDLINNSRLEDWLQEAPVSLYLHGHIHHNWRVILPRPLNPLGDLVIVNSAASTRLPRPGEVSSYHRIVLREADFEVQPVRLD
ncbi:MAG: metallophosphoesterase [Deltaproteobacteria bacterium]|nr:metallophosphoesterase [Deltaproteobacteria bacterium]